MVDFITPEAVLFDMDGLLLDTERLCMESFIAARRFFGLSDAEDIFLRTVGVRHDIAEAMVSDSLSGVVGIAAFDEKWSALNEELLSQNIPLRPGAETLLAAIKARGIPMAVATSTQAARAAKHLKRVGFFDYFTCVVGGDQVQNPKPDPEPYLRAANQLGVDITHCVAFEDSDPGTRAAYLAGATVVQVPDLKEPSGPIRGLGHLIAPDLLSGAVAIGLIAATPTAQAI